MSKIVLNTAETERLITAGQRWTNPSNGIIDVSFKYVSPNIQKWANQYIYNIDIGRGVEEKWGISCSVTMATAEQSCSVVVGFFYFTTKDLPLTLCPSSLTLNLQNRHGASFKCRTSGSPLPISPQHTHVVLHTHAESVCFHPAEADYEMELTVSHH